MAGLTYDVEGTVEVQRKLKPENLFGKTWNEGFKKIVLSFEREAIQATPVKSGVLASSHTHKIHPALTPLWAKIGTVVPYASFPESGTSKMEARHLVNRRRVYGKGYYAYALEKIQEKMGEFIRRMGVDISNKWKQ